MATTDHIATQEQGRAGGPSFDPLPEHELLRRTVREFFHKELPPERVAELDRAREPIPTELWRRMGELGWLGLPIARRYGGEEADVSTAAVLVEELARGWASVASDYVLLSMGAKLFAAYGTDEQRESILPGLAAGTRRVAFSLSEPGSGTDLLSLRTRATLEGDEWVIRGQKLYTSCAPVADDVVVLARTDEPTDGKMARGLSLILAPKVQDGISVRKLKLLGFRSAGTSEVFYDGARAPADGLVGERGRGFYHLIASLNNERITTAAVSVGIAQAAFEEALRYAKERTAFGRPIGAFQSLQHYLADMAIDVEQSRLLVQKAAWLESHGRECSREAAMANVATGEAANRVADKGMRILAGHGMTEDSPMERYLRDARLQVFSPISNEMGRNTIGEGLGLPRSY
jgi:acyl-CoA dehydrogenase